jgi:flavin reductase (DIM6/NTAB) family NADH-FMN oxidoreductase RutF
MKMSFSEIRLAELDLNPFTKIEEWALLTVGDKQEFNMMTITGLMMGQLWIKKTLEVYVHPARYSYPIINKGNYFTVSFFPEPRCKPLAIAGKLHGNQCDKTRETGLTPQFDQNGVYFGEADIVFICRKIYHTDVEESLFDSKDVFKGYYRDNTVFHRIFIGEIERVLKRAGETA